MYTHMPIVYSTTGGLGVISTRLGILILSRSVLFLCGCCCQKLSHSRRITYACSHWSYSGLNETTPSMPIRNSSILNVQDTWRLVFHKELFLLLSQFQCRNKIQKYNHFFISRRVTYYNIKLIRPFRSWHLSWNVNQLIEAEWRIYAWVNFPSLVQIMACRLIGAKPLSEPMLEYSWLDT